MSKPRLNIPLPAQVFEAAHRVADGLDRHASELVEEILREFLTKKGIDCNQPMEALLKQLDALGFSEAPKSKKRPQQNPKPARSKRAA